jgi:NDMA-dependent alcohol dehydrogenase
MDEPHTGEVLVRIAATGLCHSDDHIRTGDIPIDYEPVIGGHEAAGVVEAVGPGVRSLAVGDHVVLGMPNCGVCPSCASGHTNRCDLSADMQAGANMSDKTYRRFIGETEVGASLQLGTFSEYTVIHEKTAMKIDESIPLRTAAVVGCGVLTGWGSAVYAAETQPGDVVVVVGVGGVGMNAIQGARMAGASIIVAVDEFALKRELAPTFGATHTAATIDEAQALVAELTLGRMAERVISTMSLGRGDLLQPILQLAGKGGVVVWTNVSPVAQSSVNLNLFELSMWEKQLRGCVAGSTNLRYDFPRLIDQWQRGQLLLD